MGEEGSDVARILYASRSRITGPVYAEMERIRASAMRHNVPVGVNTALLHQSGWFVQWKEGPEAELRKLMARVEADPRHDMLGIVHASRGPRLLCGPWSMAIAVCEEPHEAMTDRIMRLRARLDHQPSSPPAVWRELSTPLKHPRTQRDVPGAFQRLLVCAASGQESFELVQWLSQEHAQPVVHRRFAGDEGLDVGTDYVDFEEGERVVRVIAMARRGLRLPLTRAFLCDYSHIVLLLSGEAERDRALVERVSQACQCHGPTPSLVGVAGSARAHDEPFTLARQHGLVYVGAQADSREPRRAWAALHPLLARWRGSPLRTT